MSPNKIQHIYDVIDRKSVKNREKMQQDLTRIYMMQVNNNKDGTNPSGLPMPGGPQEIKKRSDGEWGTLPANPSSRNELAALPENSGGSALLAGQPINVHQAASFVQQPQPMPNA